VGWSSLPENCEDLRDYEAGGQDREVNEEANASNDVVGSFESKEERLAERECLECGTTWPSSAKPDSRPVPSPTASDPDPYT